MINPAPREETKYIPSISSSISNNTLKQQYNMMSLHTQQETTGRNTSPLSSVYSTVDPSRTNSSSGQHNSHSLTSLQTSHDSHDLSSFTSDNHNHHDVGHTIHPQLKSDRNASSSTPNNNNMMDNFPICQLSQHVDKTFSQTSGTIPHTGATFGGKLDSQHHRLEGSSTLLQERDS